MVHHNVTTDKWVVFVDSFNVQSVPELIISVRAERPLTDLFGVLAYPSFTTTGLDSHSPGSILMTLMAASSPVCLFRA